MWGAGVLGVGRAGGGQRPPGAGRALGIGPLVAPPEENLSPPVPEP